MKFSLVASLALALVSSAVAGPYADLNRRMAKAGPEQVAGLAARSPLLRKDTRFAQLMDSKSGDRASAATTIKDYVAMRALFEDRRPKATSTPIAQIKRSYLYRKAADEGGQNWVARAIERIRLNINPPRLGRLNAPAIGTNWVGLLVYVMWGLLALLVAGFLFFAIRHFIWKTDQRRKLRSTAMIESDEPERSLDEWLELAAKLEAEGRYREAIRCLYVACLLRFDEHRVARFDRTQTNWEHYRRILASPSNPADFDLLGPTREFDAVWYGFRPTNVDEVHRFRDTYRSLSDLLARGKAAAR